MRCIFAYFVRLLSVISIIVFLQNCAHKRTSAGQCAVGVSAVEGSVVMERSENFYGAILMIVAMLAFVTNDALMKFVFQTISVEEGMFIRGSVSVPLLLLIAWVRNSLFIRISWQDWHIIIIRAIAELAATVCFLNALAYIPLANVTAILQSLPLTVTMFAALFMGEAVGWRRWTAILIGFFWVAYYRAARR